MLLIPAIDLKDGRCVRLKQGKLDEETIFSEAPAEVARRWRDEGAERIHLVDLNGAFAGKPQNASVVRAIIDAVGAEVPVQLGGGIRSLDTIERYLGEEYQVLSSVGHIRAIPKKTKDGQPPIDIKNDFKTIYEIDPDKKKVITELKKAVKAVGADNVWLATDEDREGEAIAWHLCEVLGLDPQRTKRITFHEITKPAIEAAMLDLLGKYEDQGTGDVHATHTVRVTPKGLVRLAARFGVNLDHNDDCAHEEGAQA